MLKTTLEFFDKNKAVLTLMMSILLTVLKEFFEESIIKSVITYLAIAAFIGLVLILIHSFVKQKKLEDNGMSNNLVIRKTKEHCKSLIKYANIVRRKLEHNKQMSEFIKTRREEKQILIKLGKKQLKKETQHSLEKRLDKLIEAKKHKRAQKLIKQLKIEDCFLVTQLLCKKFFDLSRMLLNAEQFALRIKFGEFLKDFSLDEEHRVTAYLDFIGWTSMLQGNPKKGEQAVKHGIDFAKRIVETCDDEVNKNKYIFYVVRGYRHLGSARRTLERYPQVAVDYLKEGRQYLNKLNKNLANFDQSGFIQMDVGLEYGILDAKYNLFIINKKKHLNTNHNYIEFYKNYATFAKLIKQSHEFSNKHRFIKFKLLEIKYLQEIKKEAHIFKNNLSELDVDNFNLNENIKQSLKEVENIFKNNIFMDESIEHYFDENICHFKYELVALLKGENS